ncbi:hypothetical protein NUQ39_06030 [Glaesserella parasuis]|nr:hypothetical protein [Glaesserella parasuis]
MEETQSIKLPITRLSALEEQITHLEKQVKDLKSRCDAQYHVIDYLLKLLPNKKQLEIFFELKSLSDSYTSHPESLDVEFGRSTAYAQELHDFFLSLEYRRHQTNP